MEILRPTLVALFLGFLLLILLVMSATATGGDWQAVAQEVAPLILIITFIIFAVGVVIDNK